MAVMLPIQKIAPSRAWTKQVFLMIGGGKTGKSAFWANGEKTLFLDFEGGLNHLSVMKVMLRSWIEFTEVLGELYRAWKANNFPYDTLVVDTVDKMVDRANEEIIELAREKFPKIADKINAIGDVPEGVGWYMATNLVTITLDKMRQFPSALVLISHVNTKEITDGTRKWHKETISIGGQTGTKILHMVDHTLHLRCRMAGEKIERCLRTKPTDVMEAGSRGLVVPDGFPMTEDGPGDYKKFRDLFTQEVP